MVEEDQRFDPTCSVVVGLVVRHGLVSSRYRLAEVEVDQEDQSVEAYD